MRRASKRGIQSKDDDVPKLPKMKEVPEKKEAQTERVPDIEDLQRIHIDRIKLMRAEGQAPVDTMGCSKLADPLEKAETFRFQVLIALMLSSQTKDQTNAYAMTKLKEYGLNLDSMREIDQKKLQTMLIPVSFYRAEYIKKVVEILKKDYNGDIPTTVEGLCALPGVGPKMAHLVMQIAWNKTEGVAVDVHVHRIANRLGWMKTKTPEQTRERLQEMLPRSEWATINPLLVGFGQTICQPVRPKCGECLCNTICPSSTVKTKHSKDPLIV